MNKLTTAKRAQIVSALVEGNSLRATSRMTGASKVTILRLLEALGPACAEYQDKAIRNVTCKRIQCDEIWQFCYAKDKNVPTEKRGTFGYGDVWTWVAIDPGRRHWRRPSPMWPPVWRTETELSRRSLSCDRVGPPNF